jgi:oligopeptide/dipeptide ABC transporter ATP-binding protein
MSDPAVRSDPAVVSDATLLEVQELSVVLGRGEEAVTPVSGVSFHVGRGEALGIVGESGCGKSLTLRAIAGLLPRNAHARGALRFAVDGEHLVPYEPVRVRARGISMIFQEPMTALNPTMRVGDLIAEPMRIRGLKRARARERAVELMSSVGIPEPARRARSWPHELSGGLRQRVMIAAALATDPQLILCDEPTTALDVCIQDQVLALLAKQRRERQLSIIFVTHDLAVVAQLCERLAVMYAGQVVETGATAEVLRAPAHPYTEALLKSAPSVDERRDRLTGIAGQPPDPRRFPTGCRFADRCRYAQPDCRAVDPALVERAGMAGRQTACIHPELIGSTKAVAASG